MGQKSKRPEAKVSPASGLLPPGSITRSLILSQAFHHLSRQDHQAAGKDEYVP